MTSSGVQSQSQCWTLHAESEIRCEVPETDNPLVLKLLQGTAEIFGIEMAINREYTFANENFAVFTWYGCMIESTGSGQIYESDSTPMVAYVNTHVQLEAMRDVAFANGERGPRVIVVGPKDHGKSTICRILSAYAARLDRNPVFVDLDVGQGSLSIPGSLCAAPVSKTSLSIEEGYGQSTPLVYYYGYASPGDNSKLYMQLSTTLASRVDGRLDRDADARASGLIINTCGWIDATGYDVLLHCIEAFAIDVILVMGHDKLFSKISADAAEHISVVKLPKSGGVVERDVATRSKYRKSRIREYFYGRPRLALQAPSGPSKTLGQGSVFSPIRQDLRLSSLRIMRAGGLELSEGMKLIGETSDTGDVKLTRALASNDLVNCILAVLHTGDENEEDSSILDTTVSTSIDVPQHLLHSNVAGYVWVVQIDLDRDVLTVLSPCPGALPSKYLLLGSIKWVE